MEQGRGKSHLSSAVSAPCRRRRRTPPDRDGRQNGQEGQVDGADEHRPRQATHQWLHLKRHRLCDPKLKFRWC
eukprot:COSAG02_NODE_2090_length_9866_cov_9.396642_8_plen_73_part_00